MRFEGNSRGINRTDYEQFSKFLGLSQPKYQRDARQQMPRYETKVTTACSDKPIGMVYGVKQDFHSIYDPEVALEVGTVFEELNKPFYPVGCSQKNKEGCL